MTWTPLFGEVEHDHGRDTDSDGDHHPGNPGHSRRRPRITAIPASPTASAALFVSPPNQALHKAPCLRQQTGAAHREPEQLGKLTDDDRDRDAVQIAKMHRTREQFGHEPQTGDPC
jgi:hypothetical protein